MLTPGSARTIGYAIGVWRVRELVVEQRGKPIHLVARSVVNKNS